MHEVITNNIDLWTSALLTKSTAGRGSNGKQEAYGIKKLRELILELAVRGKLVPQDPNDEPASALLKKVRAEKSGMVEEGKLKKERDFPDIADDEIPFDLPAGWEWVRINDVGHDWGQKTPDANFTYIDVSAIDSTTGVISAPSVLSASDAPSRARKIVKIGTVIYSTVRPYLKNICLIEKHYMPEPIASTAFAVMHPLQDMPGKFFALYFRSPEFVRYVESVQTGIAYPAINDKQFHGGLVPIPPLVEQHRIVAKVDELMTLCDQLEQQQTHSLEAHQTLVEILLGTMTRVASQQELTNAWTRIASHFDTLFTTEHSIDQLKQTILQLAVMGKLVPQDPNDESACESLKKVTAERAKLVKEGAIKKQKALPPIEPGELPYELPQNWVWTRLPSLVFFQEGPGIMAKDFRETGIPLIRIAGMHNDLVSLEGCNFLDEDMVEKKWAHFKLELGDIVLSSSASLGKVAKVGEETVGCIAYTGLIRFRPYACLDVDYLITFLNSNEFLSQINKSKTGAAIMHFGPTHLKGMLVPLAPLAEQHRIVAKVDELVALCATLKARINDAQTTQLHLADGIVERAVA